MVEGRKGEERSEWGSALRAATPMLMLWQAPSHPVFFDTFHWAMLRSCCVSLLFPPCRVLFPFPPFLRAGGSDCTHPLAPELCPQPELHPHTHPLWGLPFLLCPNQCSPPAPLCPQYTPHRGLPHILPLLQIRPASSTGLISILLVGQRSCRAVAKWPEPRWER